MFIPDTPIDSTTEDILGRRNFAEKLGETIRDWDRKESIVIALYGPWGSGKTSVLNMAISYIEDTTKELPKESKPIIIRFNPWNFSEQEQLLRAFFRELLAEIKKEGTKNQAAELQKLLNGTAKVLGALEDLPEVGGWVRFGRKAVGLLTEDERPLEDLRKQIADFFRSFGRRIVIVLDDIDRLTQEEIRQIFKLIKINADFPNTIYLAAFAREVVATALNTAQGVSGQEYLEKIVQVGFDVPIIDPSRISQILNDEVARVLSSLPHEHWNAIRWGNLYHSGFRSLFTSLRDVKRYMNGLSFTIKMISHDVNPIDFLGLEALRVFAPKVYDGIRANKALFTRTNLLGPNSPEENVQIRHQFDDIFAQAASRTEVVRRICDQLFPQVSNAYHTYPSQLTRQRAWRIERRICDEDIFDIYFQLGTPSGDVSMAKLQQIRATLADPDQLIGIFRQLTQEGRIVRLLELLEDVLGQLQPDAARGLSQTLLTFGDELPDQTFGIYDLGTDIQIARYIYNALLSLDADERGEWYEQQIAAGPSLFMPIYLITLSEREEGVPREDSLFDADRLRQLKSACVQKMVAWSLDGRLLHVKRLPAILSRWQRWTDDPMPLREFVAQTTITREGLIEFVACFLYPERRQTWGDYVSETGWQISLDHLTPFVNVDTLRGLSTSLSEDGIATLPEKSRLAMQALSRALSQADERAANPLGFETE